MTYVNRCDGTVIINTGIIKVAVFGAKLSEHFKVNLNKTGLATWQVNTGMMDN